MILIENSQVSHHPPILAYHFENMLHDYTMYGEAEIKNKFWGKSVEVILFFPLLLSWLYRYVYVYLSLCILNSRVQVYKVYWCIHVHSYFFNLIHDVLLHFSAGYSCWYCTFTHGKVWGSLYVEQGNNLCSQRCRWKTVDWQLWRTCHSKSFDRWCEPYPNP